MITVDLMNQLALFRFCREPADSGLEQSFNHGILPGTQSTCLLVLSDPSAVTATTVASLALRVGLTHHNEMIDVLHGATLSTLEEARA